MADPNTVNIALAIPSRGSDVGTWDTPVNSDFNAIDGYLGGVQTISVSNAPVTLTAPTGTITPSAGPTQAQNAVLRATGTLTADVQVTLPLPGYYIIENLTTGNFILQLKGAAAGEVIAIDQGESLHAYNDGANVRFCNFGRIGHTELWGGLTGMPRWVTSCTKPPFLLCDGSIYNFSTYPYLGARLGGAFGGNGITTFGVPDLSGRLGLPYDKTNSRITVGGCGINGQLIGAAGGLQNETLLTANLPPYTPSGAVATTLNAANGQGVIPAAGGPVNIGGSGSGGTLNPLSANSSFTGTPQGGSSAPVITMPPSQVVGIAVIRAA